MIRSLSSAAFVALLPIVAFAGGPTVVEPEPPLATPPAPASGIDWSGAYAGVSAGTAGGEMQYYVYDTPETREDVDGGLAGAFAGYNVQRGNIVYGGELAFSTGDVEFADGYGFTRFLDLKGRVGYATGSTLVYGVLGVTNGEWNEEGFAGIAGTGLAYGAGVDFAASERFTIGAEYLWRSFETEDFSSAIPQIANTNVHGDFGTLSVRMGLRF